MQNYQLYIDGEYADAASGKWFDSCNPYSGELWAQIAQGNTGAVTGNPFVLR